LAISMSSDRHVTSKRRIVLESSLLQFKTKRSGFDEEINPCLG